MSLVVSETSTLLVYQNVSLKWSAQLHLLPVCIKRAFLHNISGVLVLLSEEGRLECSYLGTTPSLFSAPPLTSQDLDFDKAGLELATLHKIIKNSYANDIKVTNASAERELAINISVSPHLEPCNIKNVINNQMCKISIDVLPQALFEEVQLAFHVQPPLKIQPQVEFFNNLSDRTSIDCYVFVDGCNLVGSLIIRVVASFISNLGVPRSVTKCSMLPLSLVAETCPPLKESEHKVTLTINQSPTSLATLFPEFGGLNSFTTGSNAIGFKRFSDEGTVVTVMLAKNSERYRLQSDSLAALSLLIQQMVYRLKRHYNKSDFAVGFSSSLPANEVVPYVQQHFEARQKYNALQNDLSQLSAQFRLIQKRLIAKFKVKNPAPLSNLELLLEDTSAQIMKLSESLENGVENLRKAQDELSCALSVISNLIELMEVKNTGLELIKATFSQFIYDLQGQNWEDVTDASLCYLLRKVLAKSEKDKLRAAHTSFDEVKDITKLEKRITQVLERFSKEGILETHFPVNATENKKTKEEASIPIGSKIGESSSRLLSARKGFMRKRPQVEESHNST